MTRVVISRVNIIIAYMRAAFSPSLKLYNDDENNRKYYLVSPWHFARQHKIRRQFIEYCLAIQPEI